MHKGEHKTHEGRKNVKVENKEYGGKIKGTRAKEENERLRVQMNGADSDEGENRIHEGENKNVKWELYDYGDQ